MMDEEVEFPPEFGVGDEVEQQIYNGPHNKPYYPEGRAKKFGGKPPRTKLTVEQEAYCRARAMGMTQDEAVIACGSKFTSRTANSWERSSQTKSSLVRDRIAELTAIATNNAIIKTGLNREWVISRLMSVTDRCMQAEPVLDKEGNQTGEWTFNSTGAIAALKLLGDTMGMFKPQEKKEEDDYAHLTDDDVARIAGQLAAESGLIEDITRGQAT